MQLTPGFFAVPAGSVRVEPWADREAEGAGCAVLVAVAVAVDEAVGEDEALSEPPPPQAVSERPRATPATASTEIF
ncbi:hypothetical protein ACL07V_00620 [Streptomyces sp. MB22_4]|uniref:hypothetical protein n=1 Tax=Streptomyces sp. MB22_4 TaxID=3383120 RepID=UPI0039A0B282